MLPGTIETCGIGRGGIGGGAGGGGGGGIISSAQAVNKSTNERLANFALVVTLIIFMDLRYAQAPWVALGDALPRVNVPLNIHFRTKTAVRIKQNYGMALIVSRATTQDRTHLPVRERAVRCVP